MSDRFEFVVNEQLRSHRDKTCGVCVCVCVCVAGGGRGNEQGCDFTDSLHICTAEILVSMDTTIQEQSYDCDVITTHYHIYMWYLGY